MTVRMRRRRIDRCVPPRVTGKVASRLWDAGRRRTLKKQRGMDEISFKEAADDPAIEIVVRRDGEYAIVATAVNLKINS
ncbi:hypothetical protein E2P84_14285 [Burkholderia cepacia]|uniref:Uncharacterized protein n=1 Tax=Burkholderia cepacia TaxID=292 RepID=A0AAX2RL50_BURCE|nr:hypothetical protein [Burkholderia cepacia]TES76686.1 hypothetical protein E2P84_14285 [Burkholderia cepacia]TEU41052.1 hypothetical protein E3D37_27700 [Burkholderia cepacia]TEU50827.1 hypothetical protein E3D38_17965 [Burkholderia cepacia]TEU83640.1 hypothetical protein E3D41_14980 [Burkholderia cepacia]TEU98066.1 hypothetical protein E3D40_20255 [Burkholderia cepacia]